MVANRGDWSSLALAVTAAEAPGYSVMQNLTAPAMDATTTRSDSVTADKRQDDSIVRGGLQ